MTPLGSLWTDRLPDYLTFHRKETASGSVDPVYRVLKAMHRQFTSREMALLSFLHVAYYDFGSALRAFGRLPGRQVNFGLIPELARYRCGTERRGMRDNRELVKHLTAVFEVDAEFGGLDRWALRFPTHGELYGALQGIYGNGRWAAYKASELLSWSLAPYNALARAWEPDNMGHAHSSGPRHGLQLLVSRPLPTGNRAEAVRTLDAISAQLVDHMKRAGLDASQATAETTLCDFNSLTKGGYYPGHDIHQMGFQLRRAINEQGALRLLTEDLVFRAWVVAIDVFGNEAYSDPDKARKTFYKLTGSLT